MSSHHAFLHPQGTTFYDMTGRAVGELPSERDPVFTRAQWQRDVANPSWLACARAGLTNAQRLANARTAARV